FPYADTISRVLAPTGLRLSSRGQAMSFPYGLRMEGVMLDSPADGRTFFESNTLRVTPALLSWLMGSPGVSIRADAYRGSFDLHARRRGDATEVSFNGADLHLEDYSALRAMGVNLGGVVSGTGDAYLMPNDLFGDHGNINLSAVAASYRIFPGTPPLNLGDITAVVRLDQGKITIQKIESHGGDLMLSGRGVIELQPNLPDSEVAIRFQLETTPVGRKRLGFLLKFLPHPPNSTPYFLSGTLGFPSLT
ncbi:MAG TPA: type II secretion system protein GspN, partial [Candidatus Binataceae bacterium]|nr:type II secretion system protein GspN [Candidatus Binataceae bacterium]